MPTASGHTDAIRASRVIGTTVYNTAGEKLGSVDDLMIDKVSGQIRYAVLEFGGFLGMGTDRYPLPWNMLKYDTSKVGYVVPFTKEQLKAAPAYDIEELTRDDGYGARDTSFKYYNVEPYWH